MNLTPRLPDNTPEFEKGDRPSGHRHEPDPRSDVSPVAMTLTKVSVLLAVVGAAAVVAGVALLAGAAWALITGGVLSAVTAVVLYDPAVKKRP